jgi:seryl-tRNA synthetase
VIDLRLLRDNPDLVRASQVARGDDPALVDSALDADARHRASLTEFEQLRAEQKSLGKQVAQAQGEEKTALLTRTKQLAQDVKARQADADAAAEELRGLQ